MSKVGPFILGGLVGAVIGVLYAPRTGDQTRAMISEKVSAVWGEAKDLGSSAASGSFQDVAAKGQEFAKSATDSANKALDAVRSRAKEATGQVEPAFSGDEGDELRAKIEAARARIAAQVMQNAQETSENAPLEAAAEEAVEAVEEAAEAAEEAVEEAAEAVEEAVEEAAEAVEE